MKAAVFTNIRTMELRDVPKPECRADNLILKVAACGICGTDLRTFRNGDPRAVPPWVMGHEVAGVVAAIGKQAAHQVKCKEGDRVVVISTVPCGTCIYCLTGRENICENGHLLGYVPLPGGYAEYMSVEPVALKNIRPIPDDVPSELAALVDPLACAINGMQKLEVKMGNTVVIIGSGPIGTMMGTMAMNSGASKIVMLDILSTRLQLSKKVNGNTIFHYYLSPGKGELPEVMEILGKRGADRVMVACSSNDAQEQALLLAGNSARVCYFGGLPKSKPAINFMSNHLHYKELVILGAYASTYEQQLMAMDLIKTGRIKMKEIATVKALEQIVGMLQQLEEGKILRGVTLPA